MMYQQTMELNNQGVALLEAGDLQQSYGLFRDSLRHTMNMLRIAAAQGGMPEKEVSSVSSTTTTNPCCSLPSSSCEKQTSKVTGSQFVFSQGICLVATPGSYSTDNLIDLSITSSIVLFNLAVVHHVKGIKENISRYLVKAESFYDKAFALLADTGLVLGCSGNPLVDFLAMALKNNAALVGRELCRFDLSRSHFNALVQLALVVDSTRYIDPQVIQFMEEVKTMFMLNAITLSEQTLAAAA